MPKPFIIVSGLRQIKRGGDFVEDSGMPDPSARIDVDTSHEFDLDDIVRDIRRDLPTGHAPFRSVCPVSAERG